MKKKLMLAATFGAVALICMWFYGRAIEREATGGSKVSVLVAAVAIPADTRITKEFLAEREVPEAYIHNSSIKKGEENQIIGRPVSAKIAQGQPLLWSD